MRRNFAEILSEAGVDVRAEYRSLHSLAFMRYGPYETIEERFDEVSFRGTAIDIQDFNSRFGFRYKDIPYSESLDDLLGMCEYLLNFVYDLGTGASANLNNLARHLSELVPKLGYRVSERNGLLVLDPRDALVDAAVEVAPPTVAADLLNYSHRDHAGDLPGKRAMLVRLAGELETSRRVVEGKDRSLASDLFFLLNNLDIRHSNSVPGSAGYRRAMAEMDPGEFEEWYDLVHRMCCEAFLLLDRAGWDEKMGALKSSISPCG